jgi:excisionase family DNA binding protein
MTGAAAISTRRPSAQVTYARKAAGLKISNAGQSHEDPWSRLSDAPTPPLTITVKEAARLSGLSRTTVWKHISSGQLRSSSVGRTRLIHFASLEALVFAREAHQSPIGKNGAQVRRRGLRQ